MKRDEFDALVKEISHGADLDQEELVKRANEYIRERLEPVAIDDRRYRREAQHG